MVDETKDYFMSHKHFKTLSKIKMYVVKLILLLSMFTVLLLDQYISFFVLSLIYVVLYPCCCFCFVFVQWNVMSVFTSLLNKFVCHRWQKLLSKVNRSVYLYKAIACVCMAVFKRALLSLWTCNVVSASSVLSFSLV